MATIETSRSPTGIDPAQAALLSRPQRLSLASWHRRTAGDDDGRRWLPAAIRRLSIEQRLHLAADDQADRAWKARELRRVKQDRGYFIAGYGHVKDEDDDGPPTPFELWPEQAEVLEILEEEARVVILKARQLGLTWLALHYGFHLQAFDPATPGATILGLSQDGGYSKRLLDRARRINALLPPFLRLPEDRATRDSKTEFKLIGRGTMISLPGSPAAPRSHQSRFAICDEWAFVRNGQAGPTMTALLPTAKQIVAISSGNGPPEEPGWGQSFARLYKRAAEGTSDWVDVFLPTSVHPARTDEWREAERENYDTDEEFYAEHPEDPDQALIGAGKDRYFPMAAISAAVALGGELDRMLGTEEMPPPVGDAIFTGHDWGERGASVPLWPLEAGGIYVPPGELYVEGSEPAEFADRWHRSLSQNLQDVDPETGQLGPLIGEARYDAAGAQSMKTFTANARAHHSARYVDRQVRTRKVPFGKFKRETADYLKRLFRRSGQGRATNVIAISPANTELIRQLRGLQSDGHGLWKKHDDDGPDALVAAAQRIARVHREMRKDP